MHGITRVGDGGLSFILATRQWAWGRLSTHALGTQLSLDWVLSGGAGKAVGEGLGLEACFQRVGLGL